MNKMILIKEITCCRKCLYWHTHAVYYEHDICRHPKCDSWVLYNTDKLPDWCPLEDDISVDLERENFLMWYKLATPEDIEVARNNNKEKLDEMIDKYKEEMLSMIASGNI